MSIVSIRGTHGSGKSTIVKKIIDKYKAQPINQDAKGRAEGYKILLPGAQWLGVIGSYHNACGGCDGIQPYSRILDYIDGYFNSFDHVLLEGALVSSSFGSVGHRMEQLGGTFAFLDTPIEVCLARVAARRAAKGNFEPVNPKNTTVKFDNVARTKDQMRRLGIQNVDIVDIDHTRPVQQIMKLFGVKLTKEPA